MARIDVATGKLLTTVSKLDDAAAGPDYQAPGTPTSLQVCKP